MTIGVFDSGVGGENVVDAIKAAFPGVKVVFRNDKEHLPYGNKSAEEIFSYLKPILKLFEDNDKVDAIVIACNTASTLVLPKLKRLASVPVIGFVPMLKPASQMTATKVVTVCATPSTLGSDMYKLLKAHYLKGIKVIEPDCSDWAMMIERNRVEHNRLEAVVRHSLQAGSDVLVLGCTHYHWIEEDLVRLSAGRLKIIQPTHQVIEQLRLAMSRH